MLAFCTTCKKRFVTTDNLQSGRQAFFKGRGDGRSRMWDSPGGLDLGPEEKKTY